MSVLLMAKVFQLDLDPVPKLILLTLADEANDAGESCYPGQERIAAKASVSPRTVRRHLGELEEAGLIVRTPRMRADGRGRTSDSYRVVLDQPDNVSGKSPTNRKLVHDQPEAGARPTGHPCPPTREGPVRETQTPVRGSSSPNGKASADQDSDDVETQFEKFWNHWPKKRSPKGSKQKARAAFRKLTLEQRRVAYKWVEFIDAEAARLGRSNPHVSTYLNEQRWEEYEERDDGEGVQVPGELWNAGGRGVFVG